MRLRRRHEPAAPPAPDRTHLHLEQIQAVADRYVRTRYHEKCCPACTVPDARVDRGVPEPSAVDRLKRGHRRGTPRSWALVGRGS